LTRGYRRVDTRRGVAGRIHDVHALVFNLRTGGPDAQLAGPYGLVTGAFVLAGGECWSIDRHFGK
jgi:hypothetical protein